MYISKKVTALALCLMGLAGIALAVIAGLLAHYHSSELATTSCLVLSLGGVFAFGIGGYLYGMEQEREGAYRDYMNKRQRLSK